MCTAADLTAGPFVRADSLHKVDEAVSKLALSDSFCRDLRGCIAVTDINRIYELAVKWRRKLREWNRNILDLAERCMANDRSVPGSEADCGHGFTGSEGPDWIADEADGDPMPASAIRYLNRWAYSGAESPESQIRAWFLTVLSWLGIVSPVSTGSACTVILFPDFAVLKKEVEELRAELSSLLCERDELRLVVCKNIEIAYILSLGNLENKAFALNCEVRRLKREIDLIQARKKRQEKIALLAIEKTLDEEFAECQRQLCSRLNRMNKALVRSKRRPLTNENTKEIRKIYRDIVTALHPDLHPDIAPARAQLLREAVQAYETGDLNSLRIIREIADQPVISEQEEDGLAALVKDKKRLTKALERIREEISEMKSEYPYTKKSLVEDPEQIAEKKAEIEETIAELKEAYDIYAERLKEMLR